MVIDFWQALDQKIRPAINNMYFDNVIGTLVFHKFHFERAIALLWR